MGLPQSLAREASLALKFAVACMIGFLADALAFRGGLAIGLTSPAARIIALALALQVSFALTRWLVFRTGGREPIVAEWGRYMFANGFGGLCNFLLFIGLLTLKWPVVSRPWPALVIASSAAYVINYAGTRLYVYGRGVRAPGPGAD